MAHSTYVPTTADERACMLAAIGVETIEDLFDEIPASLRGGGLSGIPSGVNEMDLYHAHVYVRSGTHARHRVAFLYHSKEWLNDPLAPFALADKLPRELHLSRPAVKEHLLRMAGRLRGGYASARVRAALREFAVLRRALDANASPQLVLTLAALTLQSVPPAERP